MQWETLKTELAYKNRYLSVYKDRCKKQNGDVVEEYYKVERGDAVVISALTKDGKCILIKQYRQPVGACDFEVPAGTVEGNENLEATAARELLEETGYRGKKIIKLGESFASSGLLTNKVHFFLAFEAEKIQEQNLDPEEEIEVYILSWNEVWKKFKAGEIKDLGSAHSILLTHNYLNEKDLL